MGCGGSTEQKPPVEQVAPEQKAADPAPELDKTPPAVDPTHRYFIPDPRSADKLLQHGSGESVVVLFDPRKPKAFFCFFKDQKVEPSKLTCGFLAPSLSSSPEHMVSLEVWMLNLLAMLGHASTSNPRLVHVDSWHSDGYPLLASLVEAKQHIYPSSQVSGISKLLAQWSQLWTYRAFAHNPYMGGFEEGDAVDKGAEKLKELLLDTTGISGIDASNRWPAQRALNKYTAAPARCISFREIDAAILGAWAGKVSVVSEFKLEEQKAAGDLVMLVYAEDAKKASAFLELHSEQVPEVDRCAVVVSEHKDLGKADYVGFMGHAIENCTVCLFASEAEVKSVATLFEETDQNEDIIHLLTENQSPFPRLHFCTMSTALGQPLEDKEIISSPLSIGQPHSVDASKFAPGLLMMDGEDMLTQMVIDTTSKRGAAPVAVINPAKLLVSIFKKMTDALAAQPSEETETYAREAESNLSDLCAEYDQYCNAFEHRNPPM